MEEGKLKDEYKHDSVIFYLLLAGVIISTAFAIKRQTTPEWKRYQSEFKKMVEEKLGKEALKGFSFGIQQIWLKEINRIDRCVTCHLGLDVEKLDDKRIPVVFRYHPDRKLMEAHPIEKFGCTLCHGGKGYALTKEEAHFADQRGWLDTFLSKETAKKYGFPDYDKMPLIEINCNPCHRDEEEVKGMPHINRGKKIFKEKMCTCCHFYKDEGGMVGPELTYEGDKVPEKFDFSSITNWNNFTPSVFSWHFLHFKYPYLVTLNTLMPGLKLKDEEIRDLVMFVMSLKKVPLHLQAKPKIASQKNPAEGNNEKNN